MTEVSAVVSGAVSGSPEVHEKIAPSGRGAVIIFATAPGTYVYVTHARTSGSHASSSQAEVTRLPDGRSRIVCNFRQTGASIVFFGTS